MNTIIIPRREREKIQRRQDILHSAADVFAQEGFEKASLDEIAAKCELSKSALYYYFSSKEELYQSVLTEGYQYFLSIIDQARGNLSARRSIKYIIQSLMEIMQSNSSFFKIIMQEKMLEFMGLPSHFHSVVEQQQDMIAGRIHDIFQKGIDKGEVRDYDAELLVLIMFGMVHSCTLCKKRTPDLGAETITDILFDGVTNHAKS